MPQSIALYRVFLAAPSDVSEELNITEGVLRDWNLQHGPNRSARLELVNWRTHAFPQTGRRPQALINKQAFDDCDVVVAIFWSRLGTRTGKALSGTVEEIQRGIRQGKPVLVYFSGVPLPGQPPADHSRLVAFRKRFGQKALYWIYSDLGSFERNLRNHLAATMNALLEKQTL